MAHRERPEIIVYSYELAPNPQKLFQFLALLKIPYKYVEIPVTMPRPMLAEVGVSYRRAPLLSIGSDMYVDTALIIEKLCDIAMHTSCGLEDACNHVEYDGLGQLAYQCAVGLIPLDVAFIQDPVLLTDRSELMGRPFDPRDIAKARPQTISKMLSLVNLVESHFLKVGKKYFLPGATPSTADMHLYWGLNWGLRFHHGARPEISETTHPKLFAWFSDVDTFLEGRKCETRWEIAEAYKVLQAPPKHEYAKFVPHVKDNPEKLNEGQDIKVTPVDSGRSCPQLGKLISLNYEQVCLRNEKGLVMHFPRHGYDIVAVQ